MLRSTEHVGCIPKRGIQKLLSELGRLAWASQLMGDSPSIAFLLLKGDSTSCTLHEVLDILRVDLELRVLLEKGDSFSKASFAALPWALANK